MELEQWNWSNGTGAMERPTSHQADLYKSNLLPCDSFEVDSCEHGLLLRLQTIICLMPVVGFFPALWTLYRQRGTRVQQAASRLSVILALLWLGGYGGTAMGAAGVVRVPFLLANSVLTSGYFLISVWLMVQVVRGRSLVIPGVSDLGDRLLKKSDLG